MFNNRLAYDLHKALGLPENVTWFTISVNFQDGPIVRVQYETVLIQQNEEYKELLRVLHDAELVTNDSPKHSTS